MICHECLMNDLPSETATALCKFCMVALCKTHLMELYRDPPSVPQYACRHQPASAPGRQPAGRRARLTSGSPTPVAVPSWRLVPGFGSA